jgi:hypothetical protein
LKNYALVRLDFCVVVDLNKRVPWNNSERTRAKAASAHIHASTLKRKRMTGRRA